MRRLLFDTNTLNYILKGRRPVLDRYEQAVQADCTFLLSPVAHYELARYLLLKGAHRLARDYNRLTASWERCDLAFEDWETAASLWAERHRTGDSVSDLDLLLAILARREEAVLVTTNIRHFGGLGVSLEDWEAPL